MTSIRALSCESVIDGAFFFHPDFQVPEEKMGQHAREHMVLPAWKFSHFIVIHAQVGFWSPRSTARSPSADR